MGFYRSVFDLNIMPLKQKTTYQSEARKTQGWKWDWRSQNKQKTISWYHDKEKNWDYKNFLLVLYIGAVTRIFQFPPRTALFRRGGQVHRSLLFKATMWGIRNYYSQWLAMHYAGIRNEDVSTYIESWICPCSILLHFSGNAYIHHAKAKYKGSVCQSVVPLYIEEITWPRWDTNFIFECWKSRTIERYFQHEKKKFVSPSGHVMFCLFYRYWWNSYIKHNFFLFIFETAK